ncbi:MAG TPA: hypothetical protein DCY07_08755, partial [Rhodospirillaceae bacterium]|nr:hypothetical protein [Rhodospirillaceae bacterium]
MKKIWIGALFLAVVMAGAAPVKLWAQPVAVDAKQKDVLEKNAAEKNAARPFKVMGHTVHAEAPRAEVCLAFTQPLATEASGEMDRAKIAATLKMKKNGRVQKILAEDLSLTADDLCVQGLEHHVMYQLTVRGLEAKGGVKLASPYTATFTVPDRKPSLAFVMDTTSSALPRHAKKTAADKDNPWGMAHVLRSVGILATHLTLYRVEDRTAQAGAWQQFKQLHLSPSESLTFARENGKVVFESDLVFGDQPNVEQTLIAPLPSDEALTAGLYYLAAAPRGKAAPTLFAGQWFLVSDLHASALAVSGGVQAFVKGGDPLSPKEGVSLALFMRDAKNVMHSVVEGKTDASGAAFLPLPADRKPEGLTLLAQNAGGALDVIEITPSRLAPVSYQPRSGSMSLDRPLYAPADRAAVTLRVEGGTAQESGKSETVLKLLRADRQVLVEQTVPPMAQNGSQGASQTIGLTLPVTAKTNSWTVSWQEKGGRVLAEAPLKVAPVGTAAKVSVSANREEAAENGTVFVTVRTLDAKGGAAPYQEGVLRVKPVRPVLEGWEAYRFGITPQQEGQTVLSLPFMTNAEGTARLNVDTGAAALQTDALSFVATLDTAVQSSPQLLPVSKKPAFIGLRALPDAKPFPENSVARFDVIALDRSKKRIAQGDLYYVVYEEGRSFDWFAFEGHWDYTPLPHHRRVGGGALSLSATGETIVSWPVTMGRYALEITSARGEVLARHGFEAGRRGGQEIAKDGGKLRFGSLPDALQVGKAASLPLHLSAPAVVNVVVTDGKIRQTLHSAFGAGERAIMVVPAADWGREVLVRVEAVLEGSTDPVMTSVALPVRLPVNGAETKTALLPLPQGEAQAMAITAKPADVL